MIDPPTLMLFLAGADGHLQDAPASTGPDWWGALAGLHPLVIHFPIALIIVAALVELVALLARRAVGPPRPAAGHVAQQEPPSGSRLAEAA